MAVAKKWEQLFKKDDGKRQLEVELDRLRQKIQRDPKLQKKAAQIIEDMIKDKGPEKEK